MARPSQRQIAPWMKQIMEARGWSSLTEASRESKIPLTSLRDWALQQNTGAILRTVLDMSNAFQVPVETLIHAILAQADLSVALNSSTEPRRIPSSNVNQSTKDPSAISIYMDGCPVKTKATLTLPHAA